MRIGELATLAGTPVETIRYYEREGLLPTPYRTGSNYRVYGVGDVERLSFIRRCRSLDMTLDEVRALLRFRDHPDESCRDVDALLDAHLGHVTERIRELRQLERQLRHLRESCPGGQDVKHCGILDGLAGTGAGNVSGKGHVPSVHPGRPRPHR